MTISSSTKSAPFLFASSFASCRKFFPVFMSTTGSVPGTSMMTQPILPGCSAKSLSRDSILLYSNGCMYSESAFGMPLFLGVVTAYQSWQP